MSVLGLVSVGIFVSFGVMGVLYEKLLTRCCAESVEILITIVIYSGCMEYEILWQFIWQGNNINLVWPAKYLIY
jgi:hypothetical protein